MSREICSSCYGHCEIAYVSGEADEAHTNIGPCDRCAGTGWEIPRRLLITNGKAAMGAAVRALEAAIERSRKKVV